MTMNRKNCFTATASDGTKFTWRFWYDSRTPAAWMLQDHEGYVRTLERTWRDSVPRIQATVANYGLTAEVN